MQKAWNPNLRASQSTNIHTVSMKRLCLHFACHQLNQPSDRLQLENVSEVSGKCLVNRSISPLLTSSTVFFIWKYENSKVNSLYLELSISIFQAVKRELNAREALYRDEIIIFIPFNISKWLNAWICWIQYLYHLLRDCCLHDLSWIRKMRHIFQIWPSFTFYGICPCFVFQSLFLLWSRSIHVFITLSTFSFTFTSTFTLTFTS